MAPPRSSTPNSSPSDPVCDQASPYYVHPSDGPSSFSITPVLSGSNYHSWVQSMRVTLGGKMQFDFVDGTIPIPTDPFEPSFLCQDSMEHVGSFLDYALCIRIHLSFDSVHGERHLCLE
ncbi:uncharacterized protein LOC131605080 [Vicia villosa]|uniref:uncharacterized protein LOC131605080 n=1 Tax=Vicia villosa TaxID=3911 RepID=UPI00273C9DBF|nr:uncharacterized protein LOC131605080 [Vicia villosa]